MKTSTFAILSACLGVGLSSSATPKTPVSVEKPQTYCHVHHEKLKHDWVKIRYGKIFLDKDYREARQKLFPFSNKTWGGGCVRITAVDAKTGRVVRRSPDFKKVDYCTKCRSAEWLWKKEKSEPKGTSSAKS
jgi:hypothetical protein